MQDRSPVSSEISKSGRAREWGLLHIRDGKPYSPLFEDVYYSGDGLDEVEHVFLAPCGLAERFASGERVVVGELGFGTGLNFLCALRMFRESASPEARLDYISCERHPLSSEDLQRACPPVPELQSLTRDLCERYPPCPFGVHPLSFDDDRVTLTLVFEDVADAMASYPRDVNAWFLDGFAPDRNVAMWAGGIMGAIADRSAPSACVSTYTASGTVKRGLREAGFTVKRHPGYGKKRHMLVGTYGGAG
ncbi:MAG: tRNA (5-methylaminomethyl-2-thiouridine)(34)-methyltransferase MnmD [Kiritimatiellae bacterium]|nr:tRNA (5-methylaminomethyl-2-thiouridine)(34)-methyltransferase MnmD [Kiritimatiellia bacterium]